MKRVITFLLAICMTLTFCPHAFAALTRDYEKVYTYEDQFSDVPSTSKFAQYVRTVYEYGVMDGISDTEFNLDGTLSIADAIKSVCHLRASRFKDSEEFSSGSLQDYISYALKNKIIDENDVYAYDDPVTRSVFALLISKATSDIKFAQKNQFGEGDIPGVSSGSPYHDAVYTLYDADILKTEHAFDVIWMASILEKSLGLKEAQKASDPSYAAIYRLYQAGILKGNDKYGTFGPSENVTRASAAVILSRTIDPTMREKFTLEKRTDILVPQSRLANRSSIQKKASEAELSLAYNEARKIVEPMVNLSREAQLCGIFVVLRLISEEEVTYSDTAPHYNDPYGFFIRHLASCAGCTRATGLCLNILGIPYEHVNENQWGHQWTRVNVNGTYWICDPFGLYCGPEEEPYKHPNVS